MNLDTEYSNLSDNDLHAKCHFDNWKNLDLDHRVAVLQELHNREADAHHMERCKVVPENMKGTLMGH